METKDGKHELSDGERITLSIDGTKWTFGSLQDGEVVGLDASTDPKLLDLKSVRKGREDTLNEAVYKLEKETLAICIYQGKNKKRPTSTEEVGDGETLWVLKRVKK
jgi:uncharacterized protein (TIGR03067 family)